MFLTYTFVSGLHQSVKKLLTWQFGDRKSHSLIVLSNEPEMKVSSTGDMQRDVTLTQRKQGDVNPKHFKSLLHINSRIDRRAKMPYLPFAMPRKVTDIFVVMKGEVPDSIFKNINTEFNYSESNITINTKTKMLPSFKTSERDERTQPWARQSLVQLAPVWGRITDPQTVQTTTSDQSE